MARGADPDAARVLVLGGTPGQRGGLEAFCERARDAIAEFGGKIRVEWLPADSGYLRLATCSRYFERLRQAWRKRRAFDLVWLQVSNLPDLAFLLLLKAGGCRILATPHFGANSRLQRSRWRRATCRFVLGLADRIGLLFEDQASEIDLPVRPLRETVGTWLPPSSFARIEAPVAPRTLRLIHAARFSEGKGSFAMVALCAGLERRSVDFEAKLVGRADEVTMQRLYGEIARHGLQDSIRIVPWLDEEAMQDALRESDVLVHLSTLDSFPLIVLEAQAAGALPLIRPMTGGMAMVSAFGGRVLEAGQSEETAADWLARTPLDALRAAGAEAAERARDACTWERMVLNLAGVFRRTLSG